LPKDTMKRKTVRDSPKSERWKKYLIMFFMFLELPRNLSYSIGNFHRHSIVDSLTTWIKLAVCAEKGENYGKNITFSGCVSGNEFFHSYESLTSKSVARSSNKPLILFTFKILCTYIVKMLFNLIFEFLGNFCFILEKLTTHFYIFLAFSFSISYVFTFFHYNALTQLP
jgi:hypothetical protein